MSKNEENLKSITDALSKIQKKVEAAVTENLDETKNKNQNAELEECKVQLSYEQIRAARLENDKSSQALIFRGCLTVILLGFIVVWMIFIAFVICYDATNSAIMLSKKDVWFYLPENVMIALLGTTTATVVGLFVIVTKYFFHPKN